MKSLFGMIIVLTFSSHAWAQQPITREETFKVISEALTDINQTMPTAMQAYSKSWLQEQFDKALRKVTELRDSLAENPHARVTGFSFSLPPRITVNFEVPPPAERPR